MTVSSVEAQRMSRRDKLFFDQTHADPDAYKGVKLPPKVDYRRQDDVPLAGPAQGLLGFDPTAYRGDPEEWQMNRPLPRA